MAPVPTPPVNAPDLSEEEAAQTPNGYPNYYDKIAQEEQALRDKIEGAAKDADEPEDEPDLTDSEKEADANAASKDETPSFVITAEK